MILEQIHKQLLTTQILLESIVDELVESNIIDRKSLDIRIQSKIDSINESVSELEKVLKEFENTQSDNISINYFGPAGEA